MYGLAFGMFAAVAGAVNGLFLWNNRRASMAATTGRREALMAGASRRLVPVPDGENLLEGQLSNTNNFFEDAC